jgi:hypothetical protein
MSTQALTASPEVTAIEKVILAGDLKDLRPAERLSYYNRVCESLGLNPLTQPFAYLSLSGKMTLYARKDAAEQLRSIRRVSCEITRRETIEGVYVVTARATQPDGRVDESTGAVAIDKLVGEARANAMMKAETKAKRRVTLSICGLGLMDETEVETIDGARKVSVEHAHTLIEAGNGGGAGNAAAPKGVPANRHVPEELMIVIDKLRKKDYSALENALNGLRAECGIAGIEKAFLDRQAGVRASFPRGTPIPPDVMETFLLDVWEALEAAKLAKIAADAPEPKAEDDKSDWVPENLFPEEAAK